MVDDLVSVGQARAIQLAEGVAGRGLELLRRPRGVVVAAMNLELERVEALLSAHADPDEQHPVLGTALLEACSRNVIVNWAMEDEGPHPGVVPAEREWFVDIAGPLRSERRLAILKRLLDEGADPNGLFVHDLRNTWAERGKRGLLPLPVAAAVAVDDNAASVELLLKFGADPNLVADLHPVTAAARAGDDRALRLILEAGGDPNGRGKRVYDDAGQRWDRHWDPALKWGGPFVPHSDEAVTPLMILVTWRDHQFLEGSMKAIKLLLDAGADANAVDLLGRRPIHWAARHMFNDLDKVELLVEHGADPRERDAQGNSAADLLEAEVERLRIEWRDHEPPLMLREDGTTAPWPRPALEALAERARRWRREWS